MSPAPPRDTRPSRRRAGPLLAALALSSGLLVSSAPAGHAMPSPLVAQSDRGHSAAADRAAVQALQQMVRYAVSAAEVGTAKSQQATKHRSSRDGSPAQAARPARATSVRQASKTRPAARGQAPSRHEPATRATAPQKKATVPTPTPPAPPAPKPSPTPTPTPTTTPKPPASQPLTRDGLIASWARRYGITVHPYDHPAAPGRWGTTDLGSCQVWVGGSTPMSRIVDVIKHEYGHVLQCRKHTWEGVPTIELERIADAVALRLGAHWTHYTSSPTATERAAAARLLG